MPAVPRRMVFGIFLQSPVRVLTGDGLGNSADGFDALSDAELGFQGASAPCLVIGYFIVRFLRAVLETRPFFRPNFNAHAD